MRLSPTAALAWALVTALSGCEVGQGFYAAHELAPDGSTPAQRNGVLKVAGGPSSLSLGYGQGVELRVRLSDDDGPVSGATMMFALIGEAGGSSLQELEVVTDKDGVGLTYLSAGTTNSKFAVRATAAGADELRIPVVVRDTPVTRLTLELEYAGVRSLESQRVAVYAGVTCEDLSQGVDSVEPLAQRTVDGDATSAELDIPANSGWLTASALGRGPYENLQARGCTGMEPVSGASADVRIVLEDTLVQLSGEYGLLAMLSVDASIDRLTSEVLASRARTLGAKVSPGAARLLDAIEAELTEDDDATGAQEVADWLQGPDVDSNLSLLDAALFAEDQGLDRAIAALADALGARGRQLSVTATLSASQQLDYVPLELQALDQDGERPLTLRFGEKDDEESVPGSLGATFDTEVSALSVNALRIELGLGSYAASLTAALRDEPKSELPETLLAATGCDSFAEWLAEAPEASAVADVCDEDCAQRACERAVETVIAETLADLASLDRAHPGIGLRGEVPVHDLDGDGIADLIDNAPIAGSWGRGENVAAADLVEGTLTSVIPE